MDRITGEIQTKNIISGQINTNNIVVGNVITQESVTGNIMETVLKGLSAYEIAVKDGFEGTEEEWLDSLKGDSRELIAGDGIVIVSTDDSHTISVSTIVLEKADLDSPEFTGVPTVPTPEFSEDTNINQIVNVEYVTEAIENIFDINEDNTLVTVVIDDNDVIIPTIKELEENYSPINHTHDNMVTTDNLSTIIESQGLPHSITIGDKKFDGTESITIPIYEGNVRE